LKIALILTGAVSALAFALPAAAQPKADGDCFWTRDLRNHSVADAHTLYFDLAGRAIYRVDTGDACLAGMTSSDPIVLHDRASTGRICGKADLELSARGGRCIIANMTKLTPEEAAAIPRRFRP
jgi:hypothetical protein